MILETIIASAFHAGMRLKLTNFYSHTSDQVMLDELLISSFAYLKAFIQSGEIVEILSRNNRE